MELQSNANGENLLGDRNETPQSMATTLAGGLNEDLANGKKIHLDDHAIEATIARYIGNSVSTVSDKANLAGHFNARSMHVDGATISQDSRRDAEDWRGKLLMEQAAMASVAQLSQRLLTSETCLHETISSRLFFKFA